MAPKYQRHHRCRTEIAEGKPCIVVMNNDDFKEDSLTGSETSHYTNVIMAQPTSYQREKNTLGKVVLTVPVTATRREPTCPTVPKNVAHYTEPMQAEPRIISCNSLTEVIHELTAHALLRFTNLKIMFQRLQGITVLLTVVLRNGKFTM